MDVDALTELKKKQKILFILPFLGDGGSEAALLNVLAAFRNRGHHVVLIIERDKHTIPEPEGVEIHHLYRNAFGSFSNKHVREFALYRLVKRISDAVSGFDLILSNFRSSRSFVERLYPDICYYWLHVDYDYYLNSAYRSSNKRGERLTRKLCRFYNSKNVISVSQGALDTLVNRIGAKPRRAEVIYNLFDIDAIREKSRESAVLPDGPYILHVARFDIEQKRQDLLFSAFKGLDSACKLVLLTKPSAQLTELIHSHQLDDRVIVAGFQVNPYPWIKQARLLVLCSDFEGFGMVLVESLACGTKVISTDCRSGPGEILKDQMGEYLVPCNDVHALKDAMQEALLEKLDMQMEQDKYSSIVNRFSVSSVFPLYENLMSPN